MTTMQPALNPLRMAGEDKNWYRMEAKSGTTADVYIYDAIDSWFGVDAGQFVRDLAALDVETINLYVNSPGGSVFDGVAIMNALRRHKAQVVATVDGLAASAASFIVQAADEVVMGFGSEMMIHEASAICWGNAADMQETAGILDQLSGTIADIYAERAGGTADEWRDAMRAETWYSAQEAVEAGLADRVHTRKNDDEESTDVTNRRFDLSIFAHAGRRNAPKPHVPANHERRPSLSLVNGSALASLNYLVAKTSQEPPAEPADTTTPEKKGTDNMSDALTQGLRERLGIPAEATLDDRGLLAAVDEALAEQTAPTTPAGTVVLDEAQYEALRTDAAAGREAREQQLATHRENLVDAAVNDGRIAPARREHWLNSLAADPGAAETLAGLAKGLVPVDSVGYTGGVEESTDEDRSYTRIFPKEA